MWTIAQGSLIGPHHRKNSEPNQDSYLSLEVDGLVALAVADGAGSLPQSHVGARLAVETAVGFVQIHHQVKPLDELMSEALQASREALLAHDDPDAIGSTLALALASEEEWVVGVVGDSYAIVHTTEGTHEVYSESPISEYANITSLLTSAKYLPVIECGSGPLLGVSVASDGIETFSLRQGEAIDGFWTPVLKRVSAKSIDFERLFEFLDSQDKIVDDTTLVTAVRS